MHPKHVDLVEGLLKAGGVLTIVEYLRKEKEGEVKPLNWLVGSSWPAVKTLISPPPP